MPHKACCGAQEDDFLPCCATNQIDTLRGALQIACARIADGPQTYEEANTPEGWYDRFVELSQGTQAHLTLAGEPRSPLPTTYCGHRGRVNNCPGCAAVILGRLAPAPVPQEGANPNG